MHRSSRAVCASVKVEKAAQKMVDKADKEKDKERASQMRTLGHL
jgi:hypothetical protein